MSSLRQLIPLPRNAFRYLCLFTALANGLGNLFLLVFYRPLFEWLGVPLPQDIHSFAFVAGFSFTVGVLAFLVFLNPEKNVNLLTIGIIGKGIYAFFTFYFYVFGHLHWFYLIFGIWDAVYVVIFFLFLIQLLSPDLTNFNRGDVFIGLEREQTNRALFLVFSLTGTGRSGMERIKTGLERHGYHVDIASIESGEHIFHFPMSVLDFVQIVIRAIFRRPAHITPLGIPANHPYDLIVVESQTWLVGMSAPVEAVFQDPANRAIFEGRDVAVLNVCRGAWRRSQAMLVRWVQRCGANVVGVRAFAHIGWEPSRLFSLWFYLIYREAGRPHFLDGFVQPRYGLSDDTLAQLELFGEDLAQRKRVIWYRSTVV
ncbi:MAG: hypothetical protein HY710_09000 [Candidatus Latescibacteria bacterium]|nr:hypothetical protein [Candidatus Latescibacterota bacterium]